MTGERREMFGREEELRELLDLLGRGERLITLAGPPGVGKSRLLRGLLDRLDGEGDILLTVLGPQAQVRRCWEPGEAPQVWLIDECDGQTHTLSRLLREVQEEEAVQVVVASRQTLGITGEVLVALEGLGAEEGLELYVEASRRVDRDFSPGVEEVEAIAKLVELLDGNPLALELAAGRCASIPPQVFLDHPEKVLDLLQGGPRALGQSESMAESIARSWEQMEREERDILARASVFRGGFGTRSAEAVFPGGWIRALEVLDGLVHRSMLQKELSGGELRFSLTRLVGAYARRRLEESENQLDEAEEAHGSHFADLVRSYRRGTTPDERAGRLAWLQRETENLRAAAAFSLREGLWEAASELYLALAEVAELSRPVKELEEAVTELLVEAQRLSSGRRAELILARAEERQRQGRFEEALADWDEAQRLADEPSLRSWIALRIVDRRVLRGEFAEAEEALARAWDDVGEDACQRRLVLGHEAALRSAQGNLEGAREVMARLAALPPDEDIMRELTFLRVAITVRFHLSQDGGLELMNHHLRPLAESVGLERMLASCNRIAGDDAYTRRELNEAVDYYQRALEVFRDFGEEYLCAVVGASLGGVFLLLGDVQGAQHQFEGAVYTQRKLGVPTQVSQLLLATGAIYQERGDLMSAEQAYREAWELGEQGLLPGYMKQVVLLMRGWAAAERGSRDALRFLGEAEKCSVGVTGRDAMVKVSGVVAAAVLGEAVGQEERFREASQRWPEPLPGVFVPYRRALEHLWRLSQSDGEAVEEAVRSALGWVEEQRAGGQEVLRSSFSNPVLLAWLERQARRALPRGEPAGERRVLKVGIKGTWFQLGDAEAVDLTRRRGLRQILAALAERDREGGGEVLSLAEVFAAGWPGQTIHASSEKTRVYWAISTLRKLGLEEVLLTAGDGYMLDPGLDVRVLG